MKNLKQIGKFIVCSSLLITFYLSMFTCSVFAESSAGVVKKANKLYKNKKYDEALTEYDRALTKSPDSAVVNFDIGAAQYKKGDFEKALGSFTKALISEDGKLELKTNYNIGNSKYKQGILKENTDLSSAISLLQDSLDYYKRAMKLDEENKDAKFNHEFVEKKLKILRDKQKKQKQQQKDKKDKNKGEEKKKDKGEQGKEKQKQQEKEKQKQTGKEQQNDFDKKEQKEGSESQKQESEKSKEMSEQEAKMLLEGYKHEEESKDKLKKIKQQGYYSEVLKDW